jgi:hypothetical protein
MDVFPVGRRERLDVLCLLQESLLTHSDLETLSHP